MDSYPIIAPSKGPSEVRKYPIFERKLANIIVPPLKLRIRINIMILIKKTFRIEEEISIKDFIFKKK